MRSIAHTVRTVSPFVILSEAKNLVVAPTRVCRTHPLQMTLATHNDYTARTIALFVILSGAKNLVVAPARECRTHPPIARKTRLNPKHITHPSALGHSEATPKNLVVAPTRGRLIYPLLTTRVCLIFPLHTARV